MEKRTHDTIVAESVDIEIIPGWVRNFLAELMVIHDLDFATAYAWGFNTIFFLASSVKMWLQTQPSGVLASAGYSLIPRITMSLLMCFPGGSILNLLVYLTLLGFPLERALRSSVSAGVVDISCVFLFMLLALILESTKRQIQRNVKALYGK